MGSLDPSKARGKIVLCMRGTNGRVEKGLVVRSAGGVGMIEYNQESNGNSPIEDIHYLPATEVGYNDGVAIKSYIASTRTPKAYITPSITNLSIVAPELASFSSLGPNGGGLSILKPDIIAPGMSIIAAWSQSPKSYGGNTASPLPDGSPSQWNIISGTSMACPHAAGAVALLKALHPSWLPSMIFSALSTTARTRNNVGGRIQASAQNANPFHMGAGQIDPNSALDPGLVYKIDTVDYDEFICSPESGLDTYPSYIDYFCSSYTRAIDLNIPSITFYNISDVTSTQRTLTNVGSAGTYQAFIQQPAGVKVSISPTKLVFAAGQSLSYVITVQPGRATSKLRNHFTSVGTRSSGIGTNISWVFGRIVWFDNKGHDVTIPLIINVV